jgi:LysR family transcriptional regulator, transcription activator of glutamate synthase operon
MELHQLRYLVLLSEELSFTRAAARGNVAQPALSRQIQKLEAELGVPLVDRTSRRVTLTPTGAEVVGRARRILEEVDATRAAAQGVAQLMRGRLALGVTPTPGPFDVAAALAAFHERHPDVELVLKEELSVTLADRLRRDELDLAVVSAIPERARAGLELRALSSEPLQVVVAPGHRLAGRRWVRLTDLARERFVSFPPGATIRETLTTAALDAGFTPTVAFEANEPTRIRALVATGLGLTLLPASDAVRPGPTVVALPLRGTHLTHDVLLAHRRERHLPPAARYFQSMLDLPDLGGGLRRGA